MSDRLVIFVLPFYKSTVGEFLDPLLRLEGIRLGLVTQDPEYRFPHYIRGRAPIVRIDDITSEESILAGARHLAKRFGKPHRILAINEQVQEPVAAVREALEVEGMSVATIKRFRDKALMKSSFRAAGVPCARYAAVHDRAGAKKFIDEVGFPICLKPIDGAAAQATFKVDSPKMLEEILAASTPSPKRPVQLEEFVVGQESSFETLSVDGEHLWHSLTHYDPTPLNVVMNPWIQWRIISPKEMDDPRYDDIKKVGSDALTALGMETGLTHLEWFRRKDGSIAVNEVAARPPGAQIVTLMNRAHDVDLFTIWAEMMVWGKKPVIPERKYATGAAYLRGLGGQRVNGVHGLDVLNTLSDMVTDVQIPHVGQAASNSYEGEGFVIVRHPETERVREALEAITHNVRVEML